MKKLAVLTLAAALALPAFVSAQEQKEPSTKTRETKKKAGKKKASKKKAEEPKAQ